MTTESGENLELDIVMAERALEDYRNGKYQTIDEILDEIQKEENGNG